MTLAQSLCQKSWKPFKNQETEPALLKKEQLYSEAYPQRKNPIISRISEATETGKEDTLEVLQNFMETELQVENARRIDFQRVHRLGKSTNKGPMYVKSGLCFSPSRL